MAVTDAKPKTGRPEASIEKSGRLGWYSELSSREKWTYWACFGSWALDSFDSTIYSLVMPTLIAIVGITKPQAGIIASAALIGCGVGGWVMGIAADRWGRVRMLQVTIFMVAIFTVLSGFTHSFWQLLLTRTIQGLGYGGELAIGGVLISEAITPRLRGRVASSVQSGYAIGYALSTGLMPIIYHFFSPAMAWRVFFCVGILPAILIFFIRRYVPEPDVFAESKKQCNIGVKREDFWEIFVPPHLKNTITATVLSTSLLGAAYVMIIWLPTYLRTVLHLQVGSTAGYLALNILGSFVGPFAFGYFADWIGRRKSFVLFVCGQIINVAIYMFAPINGTVTFIQGFFLGALQSGPASGMLPWFSELFPTQIRASGQGFCLTGGRGFGSVLPAMVGVLAATMPLGKAMGICALSTYGIGIIATCVLKETRGVDLRS